MTVEGEELRRTHQAIFRENGFLQVYGYYGELSSVAWEMAQEVGSKGVPNISTGAAEAAAKRERAEEELARLLGLSQVLRRV